MSRGAWAAVLALGFWLGSPMPPSVAEPEGVRLVFYEPEEGAVVRANFKVRGHVEGGHAAEGTLRVNGKKPTEAGDWFELDLGKISEGPFTIRGTCTVAGTGQVKAECKVTVDATRPVLKVEAPAKERSEHATSQVVVQGTATDANLGGLRMNGLPVAIAADGRFEASFPLSIRGPVQLQIEAFDLAGNVSQATRVLSRAATAPADPAPSESAPVPAPATQRTEEVTLHLHPEGRVTLHDGVTLEVTGVAAGNAQAGPALGLLRHALQEASWRLPNDMAWTRVRPRVLVIETTPRVPWRTAGWLADLARDNRMRPAALHVRCAVPSILEVKLPPPNVPLDPKSPAIHVRLRSAPPSPGAPAFTDVEIGDGLFRLPRFDDPKGERKIVVERLEAALTRLANPQPGAHAVLQVVDPDHVPFVDVATMAATLGKAGLPHVRFVPDPEQPALVPPASDHEPNWAGPGAGAPAAPAAGSAPPVQTTRDVVAFPLRADRLRLRGMGQSAIADQAIELALVWLAAHQSDHGGWEPAGFGAWCNGSPNESIRPDGQGLAIHETGVTGLALCAFLGAGHSGRGSSPHARTVRRALAYLMSVQDEEGCFGPRAEQPYIYGHATCALAMVEAYGMTASATYKKSAQRALDFIAAARNPSFGWRYGVRPGDNDMSITGWMATILHTARRINAAAIALGREPPLSLDDSAFPSIMTWMEKMTDPDYGRMGYVLRGEGPSRHPELLARFPVSKSESMTAVGLLCRLHDGADPRRDPIVMKQADLLAKMLPEWNPDDGSIDMYYWFFGAQAAFLLGGPLWQSWEEALRWAVLLRQHQGGTSCAYLGSWAPLDPWGADGGRVYSTALCALILETRARALK